MSINNDWKKRYSFRLTEDDKDIYDFIESSKESNSETIRKLLKFAILHINTEMKHRKENELLYEIIERLNGIESKQVDVYNMLKSGIFVTEETSDDDKEDEVNDSIEKSMDSMLDVFGCGD